MKFKAVFILLLSAAISLPAAAQSRSFGMGIKGGLNFSDLSGTSGDLRTGLHIGIFSDWYFSRNLGLELGLFYSQQGNINNYEPVYDQRSDYNIDYLSIPLTFNYEIFNTLRIFAGPYMGVVIRDRRYPAGNDIKDLNTNSVDFGGVAGAGFTFPFGLDVSASYSFGFNDVFTPKVIGDPRGSHTSLYRLSFGWKFLKFRY